MAKTKAPAKVKHLQLTERNSSAVYSRVRKGTLAKLRSHAKQNRTTVGAVLAELLEGKFGAKKAAA